MFCHAAAVAMHSSRGRAAPAVPAGPVVDCLPAPSLPNTPPSTHNTPPFTLNTPPSTQNLLDHESQIFSRPARTWFQTEKEKKAAAAAAAAAAAQGKTALEMEAASGELLGLHVCVCVCVLWALAMIAAVYLLVEHCATAKPEVQLARTEVTIVRL